MSNPEFLREGSAVHDFLHPGRIVIGADDQAAAIRVASLYLGVAAPLIVTDPALGRDHQVRLERVPGHEGLLRQRRRRHLRVRRGRRERRRPGHGLRRPHRPRVPAPGPGWGGSCLPKDTRALLRIADDAGYRFDLLQATIDVNEQQLDRMVDKLAEAVGGPLDGVTVAVGG